MWFVFSSAEMWGNGNGRNSSRGRGNSGYISNTARGGANNRGGGRNGYVGGGGGGQTNAYVGGSGRGYVRGGGGYIGNGGRTPDSGGVSSTGGFGGRGGPVRGGYLAGRGGGNSNSPGTISLFDNPNFKGRNTNQMGRGQQSQAGSGRGYSPGPRNQNQQSRGNFSSRGSTTFGRSGGRNSFTTPGGNGYKNGYQASGLGDFQDSQNSFPQAPQFNDDEMEGDSGWEPNNSTPMLHSTPTHTSNPWAGIANSFSQQPKGFQKQAPPPPPPIIPDQSIGITLSNKIIEEDSEEENDIQPTEIKTQPPSSSESTTSKYMDPRFLQFLSVKHDLLGDYTPDDIKKYGIVPCIPPIR